MVDIPAHLTPHDIGDQFTISTWLKTIHYQNQQVILSVTRNQRLARLSFTLLTTNSSLVFVLQRQPHYVPCSTCCSSAFHYHARIFDMQWHDIAVLVHGCRVQVFIDGSLRRKEKEEETRDNSKEKLCLFSRCTVGAKWSDKEKGYTSFFKGQLSETVLQPYKAAVTEPVVK